MPKFVKKRLLRSLAEGPWSWITEYAVDHFIQRGRVVWYSRVRQSSKLKYLNKYSAPLNSVLLKLQRKRNSMVKSGAAVAAASRPSGAVSTHAQ